MTKTFNTSCPIDNLTIILKPGSKNYRKSTGTQQETALITVYATRTAESNTKNSFTNGSIHSTFNLSVEFSKHYPEIELYTKKLLNLLKNPIDVSWVLSECYIYLDTNKEAIKDRSTLISYSKNWIKSNLKWKNSPLNRTIRLNNNAEDTPPIESTNNIYNFDLDRIEDEIESFRNALSPYEKRLMNIYYDLDLKKGKDISAHLDIPLSSAYPIIKECKVIETRLRSHIKKLNTF